MNVKLILLLSFFVLFCACREKLLDNGHVVGEDMPSIELQLTDSITLVNLRSVSQNNSVVAIYFDPYCDFCRAETESILKNINRFGSTQIVFITSSSLDNMVMYSKKYGLEKYSNIHIGRDRERKYSKVYDVKGFPHISIFSKDHKLNTLYFNAVGVEKILAGLSE
ncbi:peroxiredoxin family protein [Chitinophaga flava]|uniref:Alkyl hydroperoxide reductase subunit C/ Thiol specific antioxidant domain-containing protein n=1 Tax=Chitinophaga flava TaxID=2259036 RepID=A0A365XSM2_9BACT|nr:redoxin domain-containing protein [Chitinophaga flava]RBL89349.1 hypothetical protein DF182_22780 [Chitinophaga flava]